MRKLKATDPVDAGLRRKTVPMLRAQCRELGLDVTDVNSGKLLKKPELVTRLLKKLTGPLAPPKTEPDPPPAVPTETRVIEFSIAGNSPAWWREWAKKMCEKNPGLSVDPNYGCNNGGVCYGLRFTGPKWLLDRITKKYGYGGDLPEWLS